MLQVRPHFTFTLENSRERTYCDPAVAAHLALYHFTLKTKPTSAFDPRLAAARPGDVVPVELTVRARVALAVWPLFAVVPVLLGSSLGRDPEVDRLDEPVSG